VSVRKPEQGTAPKLYYIDADEATLTPTAPSVSSTFMWADISTDQEQAIAEKFNLADFLGPADGAGGKERRAASGTPIRAPQTQGLGSGGGPLLAGGRMAEHMVQTAYNAQHKVPWHWPVPAYVVTKDIGAGVGMVLSLAAMLGLAQVGSDSFGDPLLVWGLLVALLFTGITTGLLVFDLEKPG